MKGFGGAARKVGRGVSTAAAVGASSASAAIAAVAVGGSVAGVLLFCAHGVVLMCDAWRVDKSFKSGKRGKRRTPV